MKTANVVALSRTLQGNREAGQEWEEDVPRASVNKN